MTSEKSKGGKNLSKHNGEKNIAIVTSPDKEKSQPDGGRQKEKAARSHKKLAKQTKTAKKTLKKLKREKQAAEILMNYCNSMGKYFADQTAVNTLMDRAADPRNIADGQATEITLDRTEETTAEFLQGFYESEEYAAALAAYRDRLETKNRILCGMSEEEE